MGSFATTLRAVCRCSDGLGKLATQGDCVDSGGAHTGHTAEGIGRETAQLGAMLKGWAPELGKLAVFELAFYLAYAYGMTFPQDDPAPFWFPNSVLLCTLLLTPRRT